MDYAFLKKMIKLEVYLWVGFSIFLQKHKARSPNWGVMRQLSKDYKEFSVLKQENTKER